MRKRAPILLSVLIFVLGLGAMFYPTLSNWLHERSASYAMTDYKVATEHKTKDEFQADFAAARAYNATLSGDVRSFLEAELENQSDEKNLNYWETLDQTNGIMGIVDIPKINVSLPIYHGTEENVLQKGAGHLEGSALPTGDVGNHTVITGHTGLPNAHLFTDLDEVVEGDQFQLEIMDRTFTYEVKNIYVVLPSETDHLEVQPDKDLVTLITCTPYGVNSHRLLVQGERVEEEPTIQVEEHFEEPVEQTESALDNLPQLIIIAAVLIALLVAAIIIRLVRNRHKPKRLSN